MRLTRPLLLAAALAVVTPVCASESEQALASLKVQLVAAEAPGDIVSDMALFKMIPVAMGYQPDLDALDPVLLSRLRSVQTSLGERLVRDYDTDPTVLALELRCLPASKAMPGCEARMDRLSEVAGDNAYHHIVLMGTAAALDGPSAMLEHARRAARAPDYRSDVTTVYSSLYARFSQVPESMWRELGASEGPPRSPGVEAMAHSAAVGLPHYKSIVDACREATGELRGLCLEVGKKMTHDSSVLLDIEIGARIVVALGDEDDQARALRRRREARWLGRAVVTADAALNAAQWDDYFATYAREGELGAMRFAVRAQGMALEPPKGWTGEPEARPAS